MDIELCRMMKERGMGLVESYEWIEARVEYLTKIKRKEDKMKVWLSGTSL